MNRACISCNQPIQAGDYRLVGVEQGTWASLYAHRGTCESEARDRGGAVIPVITRAAAPPAVEELTMEDAPAPLPDQPFPWGGMERRRPEDGLEE